jgi:hypothetical protein
MHRACNRYRAGTVLPMLLSAVLCCGCGTSQNAKSVATLSIILQPANASTPLGMTATFKVTAESAGALRYQWQKNGIDIPGATEVSYTTPAVALSDSGSLFAVTVTAGEQSVSSTSAKLTVGARSPQDGDLRFQMVGSSTNALAGGTGQATILWYPIKATYPSSVGTPLRLGSGQCVSGIKQDCGWLYNTAPTSAIKSLNIAYEPDTIENLDTDASAVPSTCVINSLDIEAGEDVFAMSILGGNQIGFDGRHETASFNTLASSVANDGADGRVVTAISYNDATGNIDYVSYGWASDKSTFYDTQVQSVPYSGVKDSATTLAANGYIITAFGGNGVDGYLLVGTKVRGDSLPRPILVSPDADVSTEGYALVGWAINALSQSAPDPPVWIYER